MPTSGTDDRIVDVDGHIVEPPDVWERHIEPRFRENCIRVERRADGMNRWLIRGKPSRVFPALLPCEPGLNDSLSELSKADRSREILELAQRDYLAGTPRGGYDPDARLAWMREKRIDAALLFPTLGLSWEEDVLDDPDYTYAHMRAYNTWITEYCASDLRRLLAVAQVSLLDVDAGVAEIERVAGLGARGVLLRPGGIRNRPLSHRHHDRLWAAIVDHDLCLGLHVLAPQATLLNWGRLYRRSMFAKAHDVLPMLLAVIDMITGGVFDRFPKLRVAPLEVGTLWVEWVLGEIQGKIENPISTPYAFQKSPAELFERNCWVTPNPAEELEDVVEVVGPRALMAFTDYPHPESDADMPGLWRRRSRAFEPEVRRRFLRQNALDFLGIDDPGPIDH